MGGGVYVKYTEEHICWGSFEIISRYTCNNFTVLYHYFRCFRTYLFSILHNMGKSSVTNFYIELSHTFSLNCVVMCDKNFLSSLLCFETRASRKL
jgi:hypothetical protein